MVDSDGPSVNTQLARMFLEQAIAAFDRGDRGVFEAARTLVILNLGLSTEKAKI